jgi:serine/threonine-protein kinase
MDCGDAGHILLSKRVAEDLVQYRHWQPYLHDLGECDVKHGAVISLVNLYNDEVGNPERPTKLALRNQTTQSSTRRAFDRIPRTLIIVLLFLTTAVVGLRFLFPHLAPKSNDVSRATTSAVAASIPEKSIAVLPFENLSANQEAAFFTDGVQDQILTNLAKVADLKVISRTSVMQYKVVRARNLREIGRQLGVANVLEGSVQRVANRIRVNTQLIDARTDAHLWAQTYDRDLADVFAIQSEIAQTIADQLQARMSPSEKAAIAQPPTTDPVAQRLFAQAQQLSELASNPGGKEALLQAITLLDEALARDPHFLDAYGLLAAAHIDLYWGGFDHTAARLELARAAIERAAAINPDAGDVHGMHANYAYKAFRDYDGARAELELARKTLPNDAVVYALIASIDRRQGRWSESAQNWERCVSLDPRNFRFVVETAFTYQALRRFAESAHTFERALSVIPTDHFARAQLAKIPFFEYADVQSWGTKLSAIINEDPKAATEIGNDLVNCALAERDSALATRALQSIRAEGLPDSYNNSLWARDWFVGLAARTFGDETKARAAFNSARIIEEKIVHDQPDYAPAWSRLGLIDAGLGRKEDAIREGRRACELLPVTKDAMDGPSYVVNLATIYAWSGEKDLALEQLAIAAKIPAGITYGELKLYPQWDSLRGDSRFDKIVASLAPKR